MKVSPLRQRMLDAMQMRGYSPRPHDSYVQAVLDLSHYYHRSPDKISADEVQQWLLWLLKERQVSSSTCHLYFNGVRFLFVTVLEDADFMAYRFALPKRQQRLPDLLSRAEVSQLVAAPDNPTHRLLLLSCYACGLRVSELVNIRVQDIDGSRRILHVVQGKGQKDRYVPVPDTLLEQWRAYWQRCHPKQWLFPGKYHGYQQSMTTPQKIYLRAKRQVGIRKAGGIHSLRHAFATHSLQAGMPIHQLQQVLGHEHISSTMRYAHWLPETQQGGQTIDLLAGLDAAAVCYA